jgi:hypothetical protein
MEQICDAPHTEHAPYDGEAMRRLTCVSILRLSVTYDPMLRAARGVRMHREARP